MVRNTGITLECTRNVPAASAVGTILPVTIKTSPTQTGDTEIFVPQTENWVFTDCYVLATADYGASQPMVNFIKNRAISMGTSSSLAELLVTSYTRPRFLPQPIGFEAGSIVTMETITTIVAGVGADSIKFYVAVSIQ